MKKIEANNKSVLIDAEDMTEDHAEMLAQALSAAVLTMPKTPSEHSPQNPADLLAELIARLLLGLGHVADGARLTGPGLLLMADDIVTMSQQTEG